MNALLAFVNHDGPKLHDARTFWLLIVLGFLACLVSPMKREERQGLLLTYPPLIFVYWYLFQMTGLSGNPNIRYYSTGSGIFIAVTNSLICLVFGAVFSVEILHRPGRRIYGGLFLVIYVLLIAGVSTIPHGM